MVSHTVQFRVRWDAGVGEALIWLESALTVFDWKAAYPLLAGGIITVRLEGPHDPGALAVIENFIKDVPVQHPASEGEQHARD